jgi:CTP-dependent riboflavin kinase
MTEEINAERTPVIIFTKSYRIEGKIYVSAKARITDFLLVAKNFIPVTEAEIKDMNGTVLMTSDYLSVHRDNIEVIAPVDLAHKL